MITLNDIKQAASLHENVKGGKSLLQDMSCTAVSRTAGARDSS
jgi:hypothetical protein